MLFILNRSLQQADMRILVPALFLFTFFLAACKESTVVGDFQTEYPDEESGDLYYTGIDAGGNAAIYAINIDGTGKRMVADRSGIFSSPVGGRFVSMQIPAGMVVSRLTGEMQNVVLALPVDFAAYPVLSPTGNKIAYRRFVGSATELYVVNTDGTGTIAIERDAASETIPVWSPDGTRIAYLKQGRENNGMDRDSLFIINSDGTGRRFLTDEAVSMNDNFESLDWSPDGTRLVCVTESGLQTYELLVVSVAGGATQQITSDGLPKAMPVWSPDSRSVAYISSDGPVVAPRICTIAVDGTSQSQYSVSGANMVAFPQWSPDGRYISVTEILDGAPNDGTGLLKVLTLGNGDIRVLDMFVYRAFWRK